MTDQNFQDRIFEVLSGIETRLEKRLDTIEAQRREDNERLEKRLDAIETQREKDNERLEKRLDAMETHVAQLRQDVEWVKGKLKDKQESNDKVLNVSILSTSTVAIIIALIALFN